MRKTIFCVLALTALDAAAQDSYDIVILNGRVMDPETEFDAVRNVGLNDGRMQEGMVADIVIFDAKNVREGSGYKAGENGLPPIGLPHVIVAGVFVKRDNEATDELPG